VKEEEERDSSKVKRARGTHSATTWRAARPRSSPSKKIFFSFLFFPSLLSAGAPAQGAPKVTLERVVDGRGNRVCDVARAELKGEGVRRSAWIVRGLVGSDLVLTLEAVGQASIHEIGFDGRPGLRFESPSPGGRVTATSPASTFRFFEVDVPRKTVRCNLARLAEETDHDLLRAVEEYFEQGLEADGLAPEELPVIVLRAVEKHPPRPSPPFRKLVPMPEGAPEADDLAAAARAAVTR
jgi:hypothetical protein